MSFFNDEMRDNKLVINQERLNGFSIRKTNKGIYVDGTFYPKGSFGYEHANDYLANLGLSVYRMMFDPVKIKV